MKMDELSQDDYFSEIEENGTELQGKRKANQSKQTSKKFKKELYKQPTTEELNQLRETENLFNNNLFRLQIKELLTEMQIKNKYKTQFELWQKKFLNLIENLPEYEDVMLSELQKKGKPNKQKPLINRLRQMRKPTFQCDQEVNLQFLKPASCKLACLYALNAAVGPPLNVDINLEMPRKCFYEKDYLNYRYLMKRYYYLMYIAAEIEKAGICSKISVCHSIDFGALPVLHLQPDVSNHINVKICVVPPENYFRENRFLPNKNNLKIVSDEQETDGTAYYNSLLVQNIRVNENQAFLLNTLQEFRNALDGLQLLIVWLKQRELYGMTGVNDEFLLQLVSYLISKRHVNKHMSSYQVVRNIWLFLSKSDWHNEPICICKDIKNDRLSLFKEHFDVVFLDSSGCYNITSFLNLEVYLKLKYEATLAVEYLDDNVLNAFDCLFMKKLTFPLQYDTILRLINIEDFPCEKDVTDVHCKNLFSQNFRNLAVVRVILNRLKTGLNKRICNSVPYFIKEELCFGLNGDAGLTSTDLYIGFNLNLDHAFNPLELGPEPHDPKVKDFINFWGELSSLRRFPDGTTCEAVYFETKTIKGKRSIIKNIIEHIVQEKLSLEYELYFDQFEEVMLPKKIIAPFSTGTNEESSLKVISIADELNKKLRSLELPLEITSISGNSDTFSYTELFPPIPALHKFNKSVMDLKGHCMTLKEDSFKFMPYYVAPVQNVIQLSLNSKWPDDLEAIRHLKTAFLLKISKLLWSSNIKTNVAREYLDVFYNGLIFRYTIYHPKEIALLKRSVNNEGVISYKDNKESITMEIEFNIAPKVFGALKGIQSQHPSYGPSTALAKRWLRAHLLDDFYIPDMVINLLNASLYLNSAPFPIPVLPQIAFLRFLKFMFETDWSIQMVVANFNDELNKETLDEIEVKFHQNRETFPNIFIVMPFDDCKSLYTKAAPTKQVLKRISILAKQCYEVFCNSVTGEFLLDVKPLFEPNLDGFNVIIQLILTKNTRFHQNINSQLHKELHLENPDEQRNTKIPVTDFNPVDSYLRDLRRYYGKFALFFHDTYGGNVIGVLWKPNALEALDFKMSQIVGRKTDNGKLSMNFEAVLNDFLILGKGIVKHVQQLNCT